MFGIADYGAFCAAILLFLALPGPGTFALLTSTGKGGFRAGAAATAGLILGDQVLLWLAVAGVAAVLAAHPAWFKAVQYLGAAYLGIVDTAENDDATLFNQTSWNYLEQGYTIARAAFHASLATGKRVKYRIGGDPGLRLW